MAIPHRLARNLRHGALSFEAQDTCLFDRSLKSRRSREIARAKRPPVPRSRSIVASVFRRSRCWAQFLQDFSSTVRCQSLSRSHPANSGRWLAGQRRLGHRVRLLRQRPEPPRGSARQTDRTPPPVSSAAVEFCARRFRPHALPRRTVLLKPAWSNGRRRHRPSRRAGINRIPRGATARRDLWCVGTRRPGSTCVASHRYRLASLRDALSAQKASCVPPR